MGGVSIVVVVIPVHPQAGQTPLDCIDMAEAGTGAYSYDAFGTACWSVYGMSIPINPIMASIKQGAMITNINFNAWSPPAIVEADVPSSNWATSMGYTGT